MRAVVSFANTPFYQEKMKRLQDSVEAQGIKFIGYTSCEEVGCKPHSEVPYQFKPYAIQKAISEGVTTLLWCDSPIVAIKDLRPTFKHIEEHGYLFFDNIGHPLVNWCHEKAMNHFSFSKIGLEEMKVKQIMACCMGFDCLNLTTRRIFRDYLNLSDDLYPGPWETSRHDQMVMSFLIYEYNLKILNGHETFFIYTHFRDVFKIADSVCLESK